MRFRPIPIVVFAAIAALMLNTSLSVPAESQNGYQKPPAAILDVLNTPPPPTTSLSPNGSALLLEEYSRYPAIAEISQPMLRLAGLRINPDTNGPHLAFHGRALTLKMLAGGKSHAIALPANAFLSAPVWSHDGKQFAFTNTLPGRIELWIGSTGSATAKRIPNLAVNAAFGPGLQWMPDNKTLLCPMVPLLRGYPPAAPRVPSGPVVQESEGKAAPVRTYEDMLQDRHDEDLFAYYATSQLMLVEPDRSRAFSCGKPAIYANAEPSPDGKHLLVNRVHRPFSYLLPVSEFPRDVEVWDRQGKVEARIANLPLADSVPIDGVPVGPRNVQWKPTEPATLLWVETLDGGNPKTNAPYRDEVKMQVAPFTAPSQTLVKTELRFQSLLWTGDGKSALLREYDPLRRQTRTLLLTGNTSQSSLRALWDKSSDERYTDPGTPLLRRLPAGGNVLQGDGNTIFLSGFGASPTGDHPFLDRFNLLTGEAERLFQSDDASYEIPLTLLDMDGQRFVTRRETQTEPPNLYIRHAKKQAKTALTDFRDPAPQLRGISKRLVTYKRADGVPLSFTLYLPTNYKPGERLPTVMWAYPREFGDANTAGQVSGSPNRFTTIGSYSHLFFLTQGYAVLDDTALPVVGDRETQNNTYIEQIVAGAQAAIDKAVEMGVTDRNRVGVGGHSYGAFMTANLLAHSSLFRAGIARSGAYNRTLTPFGFQSERRTLWEAPEMYLKVSPFMYADKIKSPLLMIYGIADDNPGTFPIQSQRMYEAIRGNGGHVRLVMLPDEAHGYQARESVEHVLYEMTAWFDRYVKRAPVTPLTSSLDGRE